MGTAFIRLVQEIEMTPIPADQPCTGRTDKKGGTGEGENDFVFQFFTGYWMLVVGYSLLVSGYYLSIAAYAIIRVLVT